MVYYTTMKTLGPIVLDSLRHVSDIIDEDYSKWNNPHSKCEYDIDYNPNYIFEVKTKGANII